MSNQDLKQSQRNELQTDTLKPENKPGGFLNPSSVDEALRIANFLSKSQMIPEDYAGKPENIIVAMELGAEAGLGVMQSLQNIAVIGGRPAIFGDSMLALVMASGFCEDIHEWYDEKNETAYCRVKRINHSNPREVSFSKRDAREAGLIKDPNPRDAKNKTSYAWRSQPRRMCQMRARSFALRDVFPDVLKGMAKLSIADEYSTKDIKDIKDTSGSVVIEVSSQPQAEAKVIENGDSGQDPADKPDRTPADEIDEDTQAELNSVLDRINNVTSREEMEELKPVIMELPGQYQQELISAWNHKKKVLSDRHE